jgi:hypothetical protein
VSLSLSLENKASRAVDDRALVIIFDGLNDVRIVADYQVCSHVEQRVGQSSAALAGALRTLPPVKRHNN